MSQPATSRVIDYYSMKVDTDPSDDQVEFEIDLTGAYYQTPQDRRMTIEPPPEWLALRRASGKTDDVVWLLRKQLPGQRAAGARFLEMVRMKFLGLGLVQNQSLPNFYRKEGSHIFMDTHMDDWFGTGRRSEAVPFVAELRTVFELQGSDCFSFGTFSHLQRTRVRTPDGTFIKPHEKHLQSVVRALGLESANPCSTPHLSVDRPEHDPSLSASGATRYRSCVMVLNYMGMDRLDVMRDIRELTQHMVNPGLFDERCLKHVTRYLMGSEDYGVWLPWPDPQRYSANCVELDTWVDTDWAADKQNRKSLACFEITADGCSLAAAVKQQSFVALSSGEAEFGGVHTGATESLMFKRLFEWLEFNVIWRVKTDSAAARGMCLRQGVGRVRHLDVRLLWTQQAVLHLDLKIIKVVGTTNRADLGTKKHSGPETSRLRRLANIISFGEISSQPHVQVSAAKMDVSHLRQQLQAIADTLGMA